MFLPKLLIVLLYVLLCTCFPQKSIENVPKVVALRLRRVRDSDDKFEKCNFHYQKYLFVGDFKTIKVKEQFSDARTFQERKLEDLKTATTFQLTAS